MGDNVERIRNLLKERPMTSNEMALRIFDALYSNSDKEICGDARKLVWGRNKVDKGLKALRNFGEVDFKWVESKAKCKQEKQWYLIDR